jgi:hypothetical protein
VNQVCVNDTCVVSCNTAGNAAQDDGLCAGVDGSLTCSETGGEVCVIACVAGACPTGYSCFDAGGENACLPNGSFPGSPCAAGDSCSALGPGVNQVCVNDTCVVSCNTAGNATQDDTLCAGVDPSLTCSETAGDICVSKCDAGTCSTGYSCFDAGGEDACLPTGSFPGSPCRSTQDDECDQNVRGVAAADMTCNQGVCVIPCPSNDDALCDQVDTRLTCFSAASVCLQKCVSGNCPDGFACFNGTGENVCIPSG